MTKSDLETTRVTLPLSEDPSLLSITFDYSRQELHNTIEPFYTRTDDIMNSILAESNWMAEKVTDVVLLGGSSKLRLVQESIEFKFGDNVTIHKDINPDTAVAIGAAAVARQAIGNQGSEFDRFDNYHLQDLTSYSIGVTLVGDRTFRLVPKYTEVPDSNWVELKATANNTKVSMAITEGYSRDSRENREIGHFWLEEGTLHKPGAYFNLHWKIDENFDLHLTAVDKVHQRQLKESGSAASVERGLKLSLIGLKSAQVFNQARHVNKMMMKQEFMREFRRLNEEIDRYHSQLSAVDGENVPGPISTVEKFKSASLECAEFNEDNFAKVKELLRHVSSCIDLVKQIKRSRSVLVILEEDEGLSDEQEAANRISSIVRRLREESIELQCLPDIKAQVKEIIQEAIRKGITKKQTKTSDTAARVVKSKK